jgi:hypothetical protein
MLVLQDIGSWFSNVGPGSATAIWIEAYGVHVRIVCRPPELADDIRETVYDSLPGAARIIDKGEAEAVRTFGISYEHGNYCLVQDNAEASRSESKYILFKYFSSLLRVAVAEHAVGRVVLHAGVVGWKGRAIILPARSFEGKTTLTAALVGEGADYYSDDYAVFDEKGFVHPFARKLSIRRPNGEPDASVSAEAIGGKTGRKPLRAGLVALTRFQENAVWEPEVLSPGRGVMELIPHTIPIRKEPGRSLKVLDIIARNAIIVRGPRGEAKKFAKILLEFFDNHIN